MLLTFIVQRLSHCNVGKLDLLQNFLLDERSVKGGFLMRGELLGVNQ